MKDKIFGVLQRVGRSFMLPIAILPAAGLLLGIGSSFTNATVLETYGLAKLLGPGTIPNAIFQVMSEAGNIVFTNLPIIFAIGVAIGMARREKEVAALSAAIAFFIMHASIEAMININGGPDMLLEGATASVCGITSLQMGVFGGIIVGIGVALLHNRFHKIELPQVLSFFGGSRFVPIISALVYTGVGILMFFIWPVIQRAISAVGNFVLVSGYAGTWVYGLMERLLIPFGLHHVFYLPFWQTAVGGTMEVGGKVVEGAQNIFFAQLADPTVDHFAVSATRFMSGKFPLMIFGLPGAALAMYRTAKPEKRKAAQGLLVSAALTSMLTGITEPLEFTFLFVAPLLYAIHCVFAGLAYMLMHICGVGVGMTFSGGLIDLFLFGILPGNAKTSWIWIVIVGIVYFIAYYFIFSFLIRRLDLKTPGREDSEEVRLYRRSDVDARKKGSGSSSAPTAAQPDSDSLSQAICQGLGGRKNISDIDCCATRLRCTVYKSDLIRDDLLKATGASGVIHKGNGVQIIYGPRVTVIKSNLEDYLETAPEEEYLKDADIDDFPEEEYLKDADVDDFPDKKSRDESAGSRSAKSGNLSSGSSTAKSGDLYSGSSTARSGDLYSGSSTVKSGKEFSDNVATAPDTGHSASDTAESGDLAKPVSTVIISSPITGLAADLSNTPDEAFSQRLVGDGAAVTPQYPLVKAPEDGEVLFVFETKHALGFATDTGTRMLIHVGIDTVSLNGQGFESYVQNGQKVKKGDPLLKLDLAYLTANAPSMMSPVICTDIKNNQKIRLLKTGSIQAGEPLFAIDTY